MKISLHWLKKHIDLAALSATAIADKLTFSGLEVEHIEEINTIKGGLKDLIVGEVLTCQKIKDTDKLKLTEINIGADVNLSIVCGAPNIAAGLKVIVAPVNCTIHPLNSEPFTIKKAKIRGQVSEGMICAEDEIGLGKSHDGIIILPKDTPAGMLAKDYYKIETQTTLEIGLTANRGDAASHRGVARDLAALTHKKLIPLANNSLVSNLKSPIRVEVTSANCPRYSGVYVADVSIKPSPEWLQQALRSIGIEPINNVVDASNYILHDLGQPIHAFDANTIDGNTIIVREAHAEEKIVTLDKTERTLRIQNLVIANAKEPMAMAGVFGGLKSGITANTTHVFIESAYFNPISIRKTAKQHGLSTDASFRYERGCDPEITLTALKAMVALVLETAGGNAHEVIDHYPSKINGFSVNLKLAQIKRILGIEIPIAEIKTILEGLEIEIVKAGLEELELLVPSFKGDVIREIDVIEEIIRIYGYQNIPLTDYTKLFLSDFKASPKREIQQKAAGLLQGMGFSEIMNNSMIATQSKDDNLVKLTNPLSAETNTMRPNLISGMLQSMEYNLNRQNNQLKFYEFGTSFKIVGNQKITETPSLSIACTGNIFNESWQYKKQTTSVAYLSNICKEVLTILGVEENKIEKCFSILPCILEKSDMGKLKISDKIIYAEINLQKIGIQSGKVTVKDIPNQPAVRRDLSLVIDKSIKYDTILKIVNKYGGEYLTSCNVFDVYEGKPLTETQKSYSISLIWQDPKKSLSDSYIDPIANQLIAIFEKDLNALIRR